MSDLICYCFGYTREDIMHDVKEHGHSLILESIIDEKKGGRCRCKVKNPKGR